MLMYSSPYRPCTLTPSADMEVLSCFPPLSPKPNYPNDPPFVRDFPPEKLAKNDTAVVDTPKKKHQLEQQASQEILQSVIRETQGSMSGGGGGGRTGGDRRPQQQQQGPRPNYKVPRRRCDKA